MVFALIMKWVLPILVLLFILWLVWPKAAVKLEQNEKQRKPVIAKATKLKEDNLNDSGTQQKLSKRNKKPSKKEGQLAAGTKTDATAPKA